MDQHGSRFLQHRLELADANEKAAACRAVLPELLRLSVDVFGNYCTQKFLEHASIEQRCEMIRALRGHVLMLTMHMYGCRVIQKALDVLDERSIHDAANNNNNNNNNNNTSPANDTDSSPSSVNSPQPSSPLLTPNQRQLLNSTQLALVSELDGHLLAAIKDQNGNHVIQKCIERVPAMREKTLRQVLMHQMAQLSVHPYGCRVIQRMLEHGDESQRDCIVRELLRGAQPQQIHTFVGPHVSSIEDLACNQYGNYVLQHVLRHGNPQQRSSILRSLLGLPKRAQQQANHASPNGNNGSPHNGSEEGRARNGEGQEVAASATSPSPMSPPSLSTRPIPSPSSPPSPITISRLLSLAKHKYASNVVEQCFTHADSHERGEIIDLMLGSAKETDRQYDTTPCPFLSLVKDQYGNYVCQKLLDDASEVERATIITRIKRHGQQLRKIPYGKHIIAKIERITQQPFNG